MTSQLPTLPVSDKGSSEGHYIVRLSDVDQFRHKTTSSEGNNSLGTEEDEDDLLKEDISGWDVFDDYHKFQLRDKMLKEKKKREAQKEKQVVELQKLEENKKEEAKYLEKDIEKLEAKLKV